MQLRATAGTDLVLDVFATNGRFVDAGDRLALAEGMTSARWQVLGAIVLEGRPQPVPRIARRMGLTRQSVQASVNRLVGDGMLVSEPNPDHARSPLFDLTEQGRSAYLRLSAVQAQWITDLVKGVPVHDLQTASRVLRLLSERLGTNNQPTSRAARRKEGEPT